MIDEGCVPFECPKAFEGYAELAQEAKERHEQEKKKTKESRMEIISGKEACSRREAAVLSCLLHLLPDGYKKAQYRLKRTHSKEISGFEDYTVEFKYENETGVFIDSFELKCTGRSKLPDKIKL